MEASARCLSDDEDRTAPIEICGVPVGTEPEQEEKNCHRHPKSAVTQLSAKTIFSAIDIVESDKTVSFGK